jgi:hypothetical protein
MYDLTKTVVLGEDLDIGFVIEDDDGTVPSVATYDFTFWIQDDEGGPVLSRTSAAAQITKDQVTDDGEPIIGIVVLGADLAPHGEGIYRMGCRYTNSATGRTKQLFTGTLTLEVGYP